MSGTYKVLCQNRRFVVGLYCIRSAIKQARSFSSYNSAHVPEGQVFEDHTNHATDQAFVWPDTSLGPLARKDSRFLLPGSVGVSSQLQPPPPIFTDPLIIEPSLLLQTRPEQRADILDQFNFQAEMDGLLGGGQVSLMSSDITDHPWECSIQECPELLVKDFQDLFPQRDLGKDQLTVITISHHTKNDMSMWSPEVEEERENLLQTFVKGGEELCGVLKDLGYWSDFVDPTSGRPFYGEFTNSTFFETDERYRKLGFEIRDLGCCKIIAHHVWGTHTYVGSVFTNCPVDEPVLKVLLSKQA